MGDYGDLDRAEIASLIPESDDYAWKMYESDPLRTSYIRAAIQELGLPAGGRGLDAGCGLGLQALMMAEAVGPEGHVTGLDISEKFLEYARNFAEKTGVAERVDFVRGNINDLPFEDGAFDWVWSADAAFYPARDPLPLVKELSRVVKPGGMVAVVAWTGQQLLPGYPQLEARLNATTPGIAPFTNDMSPDVHWMRLLAWFEAAGLEELHAKTFVGEFQAPLSDEARAAMLSLIRMRWPGAESEIAPEDRKLCERLCDPESPDFILDVPGYYAFFTETLFRGRVPLSRRIS